MARTYTPSKGTGRLPAILIGIAMVLLGLFYMGLQYFGETTRANVVKVSGPYFLQDKGQNSNTPRYDVCYSYLVAGKEYKGKTTRSNSPSIKKVYFYRFAPQASVVCEGKGKDLSQGSWLLQVGMNIKDQPQSGWLLLVGLGIMMILLPVRLRKNGQLYEDEAAAIEAEAAQENYEESEEDEYDYEYDYEDDNNSESGRKERAAAWQCGCGRLNSNNFCTKCGRPRP